MPDIGRTNTEHDTVRLSAAIRLRDPLTGDRPRGSPSVELVNRPAPVVETPSGYHVVTNLPKSVSTVTVAIDPGDQYLSMTREVDVADPDATAGDDLSTDIELLPAPAYRFPSEATLVRGSTTAQTEDGEKERLGSVDVTVRDGEDTVVARGRSDDRGDFVLPFVDVLEYFEKREITSSDGQLKEEGSSGGQGPPGSGNPNGTHGRDHSRTGTVITIEGDDPTIRTEKAGTDLVGTHTLVVEEGKTTVANIVLSEES